MPYKISGNVNVSNARIIVINDHNIVEAVNVDDGGGFVMSDLVSGSKTIASLTEEGSLIGYGKVEGIYSVPTHGFELDSSRLNGDYKLV